MNKKLGGLLLFIGLGTIILILVAGGMAIILQNQEKVAPVSVPTIDLTADPHPGLLIISVLSGSPAERAGLRAGQLLLQAEGEHLHQNDDLTQLVENIPSGASIQLLIADTDNQLRQAMLIKPVDPPFIGIEIQPNSPNAQLSLTPTTDIATRITSTSAVPVQVNLVEIYRIIPESPAATADLQVGDMIIAVDGEVVLNKTELIAQIANRPAGTVVTLTLRRGESTIHSLIILGTNPDNPDASYLGIELSAE